MIFLLPFEKIEMRLGQTVCSDNKRVSPESAFLTVTCSCLATVPLHHPVLSFLFFHRPWALLIIHLGSLLPPYCFFFSLYFIKSV